MSDADHDFANMLLRGEIGQGLSRLFEFKDAVDHRTEMGCGKRDQRLEIGA